MTTAKRLAHSTTYGIPIRHTWAVLLLAHLVDDVHELLDAVDVDADVVELLVLELATLLEVGADDGGVADLELGLDGVRTAAGVDQDGDLGRLRPYGAG